MTEEFRAPQRSEIRDENWELIRFPIDEFNTDGFAVGLNKPNPYNRRNDGTAIEYATTSATTIVTNKLRGGISNSSTVLQP